MTLSIGNQYFWGYKAKAESESEDFDADTLPYRTRRCDDNVSATVQRVAES